MKRTVLTVGMCLLAVVLAAGCATAAKGPSDEQQIQSTLTQWGEALSKTDIDKAMTLYSDKFSFEGRDKASMADYLKDKSDYLKDCKVDITGSKITVTGDKATADPVALNGVAGTINLGLDLLKENGQWHIVGMNGV
jgi:hypothetical protein